MGKAKEELSPRAKLNGRVSSRNFLWGERAFRGDQHLAREIIPREGLHPGKIYTPNQIRFQDSSQGGFEGEAKK